MRPLLVAIVAAAAVAAAAACADSKKWKLKIKKNGITTKLKCGDLTTKKYSKYCSKKKKGKDKVKVKSACPKACGKCEKRDDTSTPCADSATFKYKGTLCADLGNVAKSSKKLKKTCSFHPVITALAFRQPKIIKTSEKKTYVFVYSGVKFPDF